MKIKPEHYAHILAAMREGQSKIPTETRADYESRGFTAKRHRWDIANRARLTRYFCDVIYPYASDEHIDTALRNAVYQIENEG